MSKKSAQVRKRVGLPDDYFSEKHSERPVALDPAEEVLAAVEELISDQSEVIFKTNRNCKLLSLRKSQVAPLAPHRPIQTIQLTRNLLTLALRKPFKHNGSLS